MLSILSPQIIPFLSLFFTIILASYFSLSKSKEKSLFKFLKYTGIFNIILLCITAFLFIFFQTYRQLSYADYFYPIIGLFFVILLFFVIFFKSTIFNTNILLLINTTITTYFIAEIALNIFILNGHFAQFITIKDGNLGAFNKSCVQYDNVRGYRYNHDTIRIIKAVGGSIVFDKNFIPNNKGFISSRDYNFGKPDSNTYRFIILGDSYTAAEFLDTPWPDNIQARFLKDSLSPNIELYAFALDGWGISNWYQVFINEIIPYYEFDALIMAIYGDNLNRDFQVMFSDENYLYCNYVDEIPDTNFIPKSHIESFYIAGRILKDSIINQNLGLSGFSTSENLIKSNLYLLIAFHEFLRKIEFNYKKKNYVYQLEKNHSNIDKNVNYQHFVDKYGTNKWFYFTEIIKCCKTENKAVILASIPHPELVKSNIYRNAPNELQKELQFLSDTFNLSFFDAYPIFQELSYTELEDHYLVNDGHWNQKGSDLFALHFYFFLKEFLRENSEKLRIAE
ncbi:MAG: hypothetical protein PHT69_10895 [Bacteroidales bacterium]|nr:hypothetical protein [Bacteroidales bacterium]